MTRGAVLFSALLTLAGLAGCASTTERYCGTLEDERQTLTDLAKASGRPDGDLFVDSLALFGKLRDASPDDVRDEWDTFVFAWEGMVDAFDRAGLSPAGYTPGETPPGVSAEQVDAITDASANLGSRRVLDAGTGIEQHARDVCDVDLGL